MAAPSPDHWQRLSPYLDQALTLSEAERATWLAELRETDAALADELQSLLEEHRAIADERFLEAGPAGFPAEASLTGQTIGAYTLRSPIGQGGMGSVWLAERSDGRFQRRAAVKFIHLSLLGHGGEERFGREGSILGRVSHPNVAQLLDAGVTAGGQPYLVLEHVEGQPIDQYCDGKRLGIEERLSLFLEVLGAVAHAHSNLIVHRDLKPSNVLVRSDGQVKLLDFGIAKLLEQGGGDEGATQLTQPGGGALTPAFAAPEQITAAPVTTATDVYALGVLLFVLLTGQHPAGAGNVTAADLVKATLDLEPPHASDVVASDRGEAEKLAGNAANRGTPPEKLRRTLRGDLDTIIAKALKKNPGERYASVTAFADDLRRYLGHESISARPDTLAYRAAKFAARNRAALIVVSTTIVIVIASLSSGLYIADRQRAIAERRFVEVRQLANKFIAMDESLRAIPGTTKLRSQLVADSLQYLTSLGNEVHGDKELALEIAYAYVRVAHTQGDATSPNLGRFAEAEVSLNNASRLVDPILASDPNNERALAIAGTIAHDQMVLGSSVGRSPERILADADKAAALLERYTRLPNIDLYGPAYFYANVSDAYAEYREFDKAMQYSQRALDLSDRTARARRLRGSILYELALARWETGALEEALQTIRQSVGLQEEQAASGHVALRVNLAEAYRIEGDILGRQDAEPTFRRTDEALVCFEKGYKIVEELAQRDRSDSLSRSSSETIGLEIGNILRHRDPRRALAVYEHSLMRLHEMNTSALHQQEEAILLAASAYPLDRLGRHEEAKRRIDRAFQILRGLHESPADGIEPMKALYDVVRSSADHYVETGETAKAVETYQGLLAGLNRWKLHVDSDLRDATCLSRTWSALAELLRVQGKTAEAAGFEQQRTQLWVPWKSKLPNAESLLRQSMIQAYRLPGSTRHRSPEVSH